MDCILSLVSEGQIYPNNKLPSCKYGNECYRKNPIHFEEFQHPNTANIARFSTKNIFTYDLLLQKINFIFDLSQFQTLSIFYYDEENDKIELTSTIEWLELTSNDNDKNQIVLFLSIKLKENYLKTCTHCKKQIQPADKFRFECSTCSNLFSQVIFCQQCENLNLDNNYHSAVHKFTKVYYQQDILALRQPNVFSPRPFFPPSYYSQLYRAAPQNPFPLSPIAVPPMQPVFNLSPKVYSNQPVNEPSERYKELSEELAEIRKMIAALQVKNNEKVEESVKEEQVPIKEEPMQVLQPICEDNEQSLRDQRFASMMNTYSQQMDQLLELGFSDVTQNLRLLRRHKGNVDRVLAVLCDY